MHTHSVVHVDMLIVAQIGGCKHLAIELLILMIKCHQDEIFAPCVRYAKLELVAAAMDIVSWHFCNGGDFVNSCLEGYHVPT